MIGALIFALAVSCGGVVFLLTERFSLKRKIKFRDKWRAEAKHDREAAEGRFRESILQNHSWSIDCLSTDETPTDPLLNALIDAYRCGKTINRRNNWAALNRDFKERFGKEMDEWDEPEEMTQSTERSLALLETLNSD